MQAMAKGSISATLTAHANNNANTTPAADICPGNSQTTSPAGASIRTKISADSSQTHSVTHAALTSIALAFWA